MDAAALIEQYGALRVNVIAAYLRGLREPQSAEAIARLCPPTLAPVDTALIEAVAASIGLALAAPEARATFLPPR